MCAVFGYLEKKLFRKSANKQKRIDLYILIWRLVYSGIGPAGNAQFGVPRAFEPKGPVAVVGRQEPRRPSGGYAGQDPGVQGLRSFLYFHGWRAAVLPKPRAATRPCAVSRMPNGAPQDRWRWWWRWCGRRLSLRSAEDLLSCGLRSMWGVH